MSFSTDYQIIDKNLNIVIRQEIINSASEFDFVTYNQFIKSHQPKSPK